ncbi:MAG: hypothetical protein EHM37_04755 [Deltaproteobacteria bacterium]|nr:MAG: hypothetical protein EHM37_04755 [Deltaproteobacteria bacterium]
MDRKEAERIYDAGREAVVEALMALDARIRKLEEPIARLTRNSSNSSRPPSSDPPGSTKRHNRFFRYNPIAIRSPNYQRSPRS